MGWPVVPVDSGGVPVTEATNGLGAPVTIATNGLGIAVTLVESGGMPVVGATSFTPEDLTPSLWLEPAQGGLFQSNAGTMAATANGDPVGFLTDLSGNANHYTSVADDTTRPTLQGVGANPLIRFDGVNDLLRREASLGLLAGGAYTLAFAIRGNSPVSDSRMFAEGSSLNNNPLFIVVQASAGTPTSSSALYRNDAGLQLVSPATMTNAGVFDGSDRVLIITDDGTFIRSYVDGAVGAATGWTPSGTVTLDRSCIGALLRAVSGNWWAGDVYGMVAVPRVVTDTERANLTTYMGNLAGLSL